ncbi:MAG: autotransporter outer membrane beta-barrel domain-containing protein [Puniceicoccales bacterium]|jgi:hypothetical protein|nr:autotransporter outer membrane beta-barrel domain-containing protein [Puniceicoccales bacterium]
MGPYRGLLAGGLLCAAFAPPFLAVAHGGAGALCQWIEGSNELTIPVYGRMEIFGIDFGIRMLGANYDSTVDCGGKTLIIDSDGQIFCYDGHNILTENRGGETCTIYLGNVQGSTDDRPFTVLLTGTELRFLSRGERVAGLGIAQTHGTATDLSFIHFNTNLDPNMQRLTWKIAGMEVALFGVGHVGENTRKNAFAGWWCLENFPPNSLLVAAGRGQSLNEGGSSIFGCGGCQADNTGAFSNWSIGDFGKNITLATLGSDATIFGPGWTMAKNGFHNWTIGNMVSGTTLSASGNHAAVFGPAWVGSGTWGNCSNWTVEFQGSATLVTTGSANAALATLGGAQNSDMRFYFNGLEEFAPSVTVAALNLDGDRMATDGGAIQRGQALALGKNFQLNVGRARKLDENWATVRCSGPENPTDCDNGTWETDASVGTGGRAEGGVGTLHLLGTVAMAKNNSTTEGSILRVDSGWKVNCYQSVQDFRTIEIINGRMELRAERDAVFSAAASQLWVNIALLDGDGNVFQNVKNSQYPSCDSLRAGLVSIDLSNYPVAGGLILKRASGEKILFGTSVSGNQNTQTGALVICGNGNAKLTVVSKSDGTDLSPVFGLDIPGQGSNLNPSLPVNCWIVQMPDLENPADVGKLLNGLVREREKIGETNYYRVKDGESLVVKQGTEYAEITNLNLLWCEDPDCPGLHLATVDGGAVAATNPFAPKTPVLVPPHFAPTEYARSFAHGALAELGIAADRALLAEENFSCEGTGPFLGSRHSHLRRDEAGGFGYRGKLSGGLVGWRTARELSPRALLRPGACVSYARVRADFFGSAVSRRKDMHQRRWNAVFFATLEYCNAHQELSKFYAAAGAGRSRSRMDREDGHGHHFLARPGGAQAFAAVGGFRELLRSGNWKIGPRMGLSYNWQRQNGHGEICDIPAESAAVGAVGHHFLTTALGIGLEGDIAGRENSRRRGQISSSLTWNCRALQHHSSPRASIQSTGLGEFAPAIAYGPRSSAAISLKIYRRLDLRWSLSAHWLGDVIHGRANSHAGAQLCYEF